MEIKLAASVWSKTRWAHGLGSDGTTWCNMILLTVLKGSEPSERISIWSASRLSNICDFICSEKSSKDVINYKAC